MPTRRHVLSMLGAGLVSLSLGGVRLALAAAPLERRFVLVILRGALDGLAAVPPLFDPDYRSQRGILAFNEPGRDNGALDLDGRYGLHPALGPLLDLWQAKELAVVHAVATPYRERSHFDGQDLLENGTAAPHAASDGWLNRALGLMGGDGRRLGLSVGQTVPLVLRGETPIGAWSPSLVPDLDPDFLARLAALYEGDPVLGPAIAEGIAAERMNDAVLGEEAMLRKQEMRPRQAFKAAGTAVGKLLAEPGGARIAVLEGGGWDTHSNQGLLAGRLALPLAGLADGLLALKDGLGAAWRDTAVLVVTEFGRTVAPNGTGGTDHGTASVALLAGGRVAGGAVVARWPGLAPGNLFEGRDLAPTTDLRAVAKAALVHHLGLERDTVDRAVFPDSAEVRPLDGLFRA